MFKFFVQDLLQWGVIDCSQNDEQERQLFVVKVGLFTLYSLRSPFTLIE